jgi:hypothetical protein
MFRSTIAVALTTVIAGLSIAGPANAMPYERKVAGSKPKPTLVKQAPTPTPKVPYER